ncbi:hypothetical protein C0Q70_13254 [Pomacea canaliculata]|uniref:Uncharacterized protein n=1 Tax=Pomacea canaliculata TaxID=400727 RepID=A0A2T7NWQ8_POMCA|nr:hypothetical protein C0Q70_13254 [Pomacea canaliculata]
MSLSLYLCLTSSPGTELEMALIESSDNSLHSNRTNTASSTSGIHDSHLVHSGHGDSLQSQGPGVVHIQNLIPNYIHSFEHHSSLRCALKKEIPR